MAQSDGTVTTHYDINRVDSDTVCEGLSTHTIWLTLSHRRRGTISATNTRRLTQHS